MTIRRNQPAPSDLPVRPDKYFIACFCAELLARTKIRRGQSQANADVETSCLGNGCDAESVSRLAARRSAATTSENGRDRPERRPPNSSGRMFIARSYLDARLGPQPALRGGKPETHTHQDKSEIQDGAAPAQSRPADRQVPRTSRPGPAVERLRSHTEDPREPENEVRPQGRASRADRSAGECDQQS